MSQATSVSFFLYAGDIIVPMVTLCAVSAVTLPPLGCNTVIGFPLKLTRASSANTSSGGLYSRLTEPSGCR